MGEQKHTEGFDKREVDLVAVAFKLWSARGFILKACVAGVAVAFIVMFSIPKEYVTTVKLAPENSGRAGGNIEALASMVGQNIINSNREDALNPDLYPDIITSTPFMLDLLDVKVSSLDGKTDTTLYGYIMGGQRYPWWNYVVQSPLIALDWVLSLFREDETVPVKVDPFRLTRGQEKFVKKMRGRLALDMDKKTGTITVSVMMQDPQISAVVAGVVLEQLQDYVADYRTRKARHNLAFAEQLYGEAKQKYFRAQQEYARFADRNKNVISQSYAVEQDRLRNEMTLTYNVYTQMAQQLEACKVKVQEVTPVFTVIETPRVPARSARPNKILLLVGFVCLSFVLASAWAVAGEDVKDWVARKGAGIKGED